MGVGLFPAPWSPSSATTVELVLIFGGSLMALFVIGLVFFITLHTATKKLFGK
jgi:hypothetical protein